MIKTIKMMLPVLLLCIGTVTYAQDAEEEAVTEVAPKGDTRKGYNRVQLDFNGTWWTGSKTGMGGSLFQQDAPVTADKDFFWGFDASYLRGIRILKSVPLFVEVGATMVYSSIDNVQSNPGNYLGEDLCDVTVRQLSFEVPVFLTYHFTFNNGMHLAPYAGAKFRANVMMHLAYMKSVRGEKFETNELLKSEYYVSDGNILDSKYRRFQVCGEVGLNFGYKALNLKVAYFYNSSAYKGVDSDLVTHLSCDQQGVIAGVGVIF